MREFFIRVGTVDYPLTPVCSDELNLIRGKSALTGDIVGTPVFIDEGGRLWPKPDRPYEVVEFEKATS